MRRQVGAGLWLLSAVTLPVELVVGWLTGGRYDWLRQTISELGVACGETFCSSAHAWLNGALVLAGSALVVGTLLLAP
ncbi:MULTISPECIES: hypothetical protein [unclassified Luteococcus]|uniref:hypothetical protein n=1 Tax=unclassified Luteococcus TaxID=2639923 RepID=UPI00313B75DA